MSERPFNAQELFASYQAQLSDGYEPDGSLDSRYVLIERSTRDRSCWITTHETPERAADYHDGQEYSEDWYPELLYDTETGARWFGRIATSWEDHPDGPLYAEGTR